MRSVPCFLLLLGLLAACGNANDGKRFHPYGRPATASAAGSTQTGSTASVPKLLFCKNPIFMSDDQGFNQAFAGSVLCPVEGLTANVRGNMVRLKVSANMPVNVRLCMIPFVGDYPSLETCFAINGQADLVLSTDQYSSIAVLAESSLDSYKNYITNPNSSAPSRVIFSL